MSIRCVACHQRYPQIKRSATRQPYCKECFFSAFEEEVHQTIIDQKLFSPNDRVAVAISGGKDSTVLAHLMKVLNERHNYQLSLFLLAIDEGISGYRDHSLETVKRNEKQFGLPLEVVSYEDLYGWRMDQVVATVGKKNNCTFCGVFRRQALDRGAIKLNATKICTGHNADDAAETALMNILRGDIGRLARCSDSFTGRHEKSAIPRCKPLMFTYEKEIVLYAHFKSLDYFSTECTYAPNAYRGSTRDLIKSLEAFDSQVILNILSSMSQLYCSETFAVRTTPGRCERCQWISSNPLCKCCLLLEGLNAKNPNIALVNKSRRERFFKGSRTDHKEITLSLNKELYSYSCKHNRCECFSSSETLVKQNN